MYRIAGLKVKLDCQRHTMERARKYDCGELPGKPDMVIATTPEEIRAACERSKFGEPNEDLAYLYDGTRFYRRLLSDFNGMMLHASAVVVDNCAYLFSAPSGTGKSTHTALWLKLFGSKAYILNDDKPAIRIMDDGIVYACGTPWSGKHDISVNECVPLRGICFLRRDTENRIVPLSPKDAALKIYHGTLRKIEKQEILKLFEIIHRVLEQVPVYEMGCTPDLSAAELAYQTMSGREKT